jgi:hypothetical protein
MKVQKVKFIVDSVEDKTVHDGWYAVAYDIVNKKEVPLSAIDRAAGTNSYFSKKLFKLMGQVLTQCDAVFTDKQQSKAFKDEIKNKFHSILGDVYSTLEKKENDGFCKYVNEMSDEEFEQLQNEGEQLSNSLPEDTI